MKDDNNKTGLVLHQLIDHQNRLQFVIDGSRLGTWEWNVQTNETVFNQAWAEMLGYTLEELSPYDYGTWVSLMHPEDLEKTEAVLRSCVAGMIQDYECEFRMKSKDRGWVWILDRGRIMSRDPDGNPVSMFGTHTDITRLKHTHEELELTLSALAQSEKRYRDYINSTPYGVFVVDAQGFYQEVNPAACEISGYGKEQLLTMNISDLRFQETADSAADFFKSLRREGRGYGEFAFPHGNGSRRWWSVHAVKLSENRFLGFCHDITDRKTAEDALKQSEEKFFLAFRTSPYAITITRASDGKLLEINDGFTLATGYTREEALASSSLQLKLWVSEADRDEVVRELVTGGKVTGREYLFRRKNDTHLVGLFSAALITLRDELCVVSSINDISARKETEEALRTSEERFRVLVKNSSDILVIINADTTQRYVSPAAERITGYPSSELVGVQLSSIIHPEDLDRVAAAWSRAVANPDQIISVRYRHMHKTRGWVHLEALGQNFIDEPSVNGMVASVRDITEQLASETEKARLEEQLQQAMKMEAIGRLAGGVAHDFNNLLTGISGNLELAMMDLEPGSPLAELLGEVAKAAASATSLTNQLLAFSRKQLIEPRVHDLNALLTSIQKLLPRLLGEDIQIQVNPAPGLWSVLIDPGQFEQIVVNLAINARDAMPGGGKLLIKTSNIILDEEYRSRHADTTAGEYVLLAVSDTGEGMNSEVQNRLFEPFFTTKPKGRGTGLGLATIYGTVKQSGGSIEVYSEVGLGTTFKIYLPRVAGKTVQPASVPPPETLRGGKETILLVEDDEIVRELARKVLLRLGYQVLQAPDGPSALTLAREFGRPIELLMTDVVMPGMNGRQLAEKLLKLHPEARVLYTSGYTENVIVHHGIVDEDLNFLSKPYSPRTLAAKLREVLENNH